MTEANEPAHPGIFDWVASAFSPSPAKDYDERLQLCDPTDHPFAGDQIPDRGQ